MYIFLISILGFILRLINIDKPEGLWNDEYVSWLVASTPFGDGFWSEVLKQCHMPLYYIYLKPFSGFSDIVLRLTSVVPSVIAISVMYLAGKEFSKKTGYLCAAITAVLPFLIYYSQEVRFYSLLFLFSALSLLFTLKLAKGKQAWFGYGISSVLILLTHVLGGIYVFLTFIYVLYKRKNLSLKYILGGLIAGICILPLGLHILKMLPSSQWWGIFSYTNILFLFSDFFSPILTNHINAPSVFFYSKNILFNTLLLIPTIICLYGIIKGGKHAKGLFLVAISTVFLTAILAISGKIVFITKYNIEILPILILLFVIGMQGKLGRILLIVLGFLYIGSIFTPYYPAKTFRSEGNKLVCDILNSMNSDKIIFTYYEPNRFFRYLDTNCETMHISKINRFDYLDNPSSIMDSVKISERVSVVFLDSVSFIPPQLLDEAKAKNVPEMFITFSTIKDLIIKELSINYSDFNIQNKGNWTVINAKRLK